jgi:hypothetical protein
MKKIASLLMLALAIACSREPQSMQDFFPDSQDDRRHYQVLVDGMQRLFYVLKTKGVNAEDPKSTVLFYTDPRHDSRLGEWFFVVTENNLKMVLKELEAEYVVCHWPPVPGEAWWAAGLGVSARCLNLETVNVTAGRFKNCIHMEYKFDQPVFELLNQQPGTRENKMELWLAPFAGPVRLLINDSYEEELVEQY